MFSDFGEVVIGPEKQHCASLKITRIIIQRSAVKASSTVIDIDEQYPCERVSSEADAIAMEEGTFYRHCR